MKNTKMQQDWIKEYIQCNTEVLKNQRGGEINFIKGFCNSLLSILDNVESMNKKKIIDWTIKLREMSFREDMNSFVNLKTRRNQAQKLIFLLEDKKDIFKEEDYKQIKQLLKNILLENFARQILPNTSWIVKKHWHKNENYLNNNDMLDKKVLEPREYIWINPEAYSDLDSPSIVTALTPAKYTQPEHTHENNYEITFYTWKSIAQYKNNWQTYDLEANFWDFIIFPPNTIHTIYNPWDEALMNISIKLPSALLDRWEEIDNRPWKGEIRKPKETNIKWVYKATFEKEWVPYYIKIFNFSEIEGSIKLDSENRKSCFYIVKWDFIWKFEGENRRNSLSQWDNIILDVDKSFDIQSLNQDWVIYSVFLEN